MTTFFPPTNLMGPGRKKQRKPPIIWTKNKNGQSTTCRFPVYGENDSLRRCLAQRHRAFVVSMSKEQPENSCFFLTDLLSRCRRRKQCGHRGGPSCTPLSKTCCNSRFRVCSINGDRRTCARMANLGLLPGCELELLCRGNGQQCMIKINGGTLSLDAPTAASIMVAPL